MFEDVISHIKSLFPGQSFIPLHEPRFTGNERAYVMDCIDSTFVSSVGKYVDRFEEELAAYTGAKYAVATGNGTAALHTSLVLAGVQPEDMVITQALSFVATANAIAYSGAGIIFADIEMTSLGMCPDKLRTYLETETEKRDDGFSYTRSGRRIRACVPMHTFGHPCKIDEIVTLCKEYNIWLIEDAAESIGSFYKEKHTGTFGNMGTFSFNGNKTITAGGGGAIITDDEELAKMAKHLTTQAKVPHRWDFVHDHVGYNYRMPNLNAALLCAQLEQLTAFVDNKRALAKDYAGFFAGNAAITFVSEPEHTKSNYWLCSILLENEHQQQAFLGATNDNGIMTRPVWKLLHTLPMFMHAEKTDLSNSIEIEKRLVNIPSSVRV